MNDLAVFIASREASRLAKSLATLLSIGGKGTTADVNRAGKAAGAPDISKWGVGTLFRDARTYVSQRPDGWSILPDGRTFVLQAGFDDAATSSAPGHVRKETVAIGHGHSRVWKDLRDFLRETYECEVIEFNSKSASGLATVERLDEMLTESTMAFLVATAEDDQADGTLRARQNVIHEVGLFQGKHGFKRAVVLRERGCEEFSNITGLGQILFEKDDILSATEEIRRYLRDRIGMKLR